MLTWNKRNKLYKTRMRCWCWTYCIMNTVEGRYWATYSEPVIHNRITSGPAEKREHWYSVVSRKNKRFFLFPILYAFLCYKAYIYTTKYSQLSCARHYVHTWPSTFYYKSIFTYDNLNIVQSFSLFEWLWNSCKHFW